jgi:hypothetical protein
VICNVYIVLCIASRIVFVISSLLSGVFYALSAFDFLLDAEAIGH